MQAVPNGASVKRNPLSALSRGGARRFIIGIPCHK